MSETPIVMDPGHAGNGHASPSTNPYDFDARAQADLTPHRIDGIKWKGKTYCLVATNERGSTVYNNAKAKAFKMDDGRLVGLNGGGELPSLIVSLCLFEVTNRKDGTEALRPISQESVQRDWPPHFVQELSKDALRISHIDQPDRKARAKRISELERELRLLRSEDELVEINEKAGSDAKDDAGDDLVGNSSGATLLTSS